MQPQSYVIDRLTQLFDGVFQLILRPKNRGEVFPFIAGQFIQLKYDKTPTPNSSHMFSIGSSPNTRDVLELCFRVYGPWTTALSQAAVGSEVSVTGPFGKFIWSDGLANVVFLAGGVGVVPMLSMLRFIIETNQRPVITLLYGNRTVDQIAYQTELNEHLSKLSGSKLVDVLSDVAVEDPSWHGYTGFITDEILTKEVDFITAPTFFLCGPPIFVQLMKKLLLDRHIDQSKIREELYSSPPPPKINV